MKKTLLYSILLVIVLIFAKYYLSSYSISYKVNNYNIKTVYKNKRFYYEINDGTHLYNFDVYSKRKLSKSKITSIKKIEDEEKTFICIYPMIKNIKTYPLCYKDNEFIDYNLIDSPLLEEYREINVNVDKPNKDFVYYNTLNSNEYAALWNYKGYIVMNGNSYKNIELFKKDKYDNSLAYMIGSTIYMANNDEEHEYSSLISFDLVTLSYETINLGYNIDFDSYIVGNVKKNLYIFDNKYSVLYEINTKNYKVNIIGNNEKGFVKYENGEFVNCSKTVYKVDKIKFNNKESIYTYTTNNGVYKNIKDNNKINQKINNNDISVINEYKNKLFYSFEDYFYYYIPSYGNSRIFYSYELTFNSDNTIFMYIK